VLLDDLLADHQAQPAAADLAHVAAREKRLKMRGKSVSGMPTPGSRTYSTAHWPLSSSSAIAIAGPCADPTGHPELEHDACQTNRQPDGRHHKAEADRQAPISQCTEDGGRD
jgi:hypothetical protein